MTARLPIDGFTLALVLTCVSAALAPRFGMAGGNMHLEHIVTPAIFVMFFMHGAALPLNVLLQGARNIRLHLFIQAVSYLLFPIVGLLLMVVGRSLLSVDLAIGFFFLSVVSSTISSSVAITGVANGNVTGALFNATLSSILGVCITPLYAGLIATSTSFDVPIAHAMLAVAGKVLIPLGLGQLARPLLGVYVGQRPYLVGMVDRACILLIVYGAACDAMVSGGWRHQGLATLALTVLLAAALFYVMVAITRWIARTLGYSRADEIAAVFCASQKSLGNGLPIAKVMFGSTPALGAIVLPLLVYHQIQLAFSVRIAKRYNAASGTAHH